MNEDGSFQSDISMLHMPMKLNQRLLDEFNRDGRRLPNGEQFRVDKIYIP